MRTLSTRRPSGVACGCVFASVLLRLGAEALAEERAGVACFSLRQVAEVCKYYAVPCDHHPAAELPAAGLSRYKGVFLGGGCDWRNQELVDKVLGFVRKGGIVIGMMHHGFRTDWLQEELPLGYDPACFDSPVLLEKSHPLFNGPFCFSKSVLDFYEPSHPFLEGRTYLVAIHGGRCYGSLHGLSKSWTPLVMGGAVYGSRNPAYKGPHYSWVEGTLGKGKIVVTSMAVLYSIGRRTEAGMRMMANLLKYTGCTPRIVQEEKGEFIVRKDADELECLCRSTADEPVMDGKLDDACWRAAEGVNRFVLLRGRAMARKQTIVLLLHRERALYFAFNCKDDKPGEIKAELTGRDVNVFSGDCVELFLQPEGDDGYYHFAVGAGGATYDGRLETNLWNGKWEAKAARYAHGWTAEIRIPFRTLTRERPKDGARWRANFCREEKQLKENSTWAPTAFFHNPDAFGTIVFGNR